MQNKVDLPMTSILNQKSDFGITALAIPVM